MTGLLATRRALFLLLFAACTAGLPDDGAAGGRAAAADSAYSFRALVYNIHAGKDMAGTENLEGVVALIRETGADVVLIQEVDRGTRRSGGVDQLGQLERLTGFHAAFGRTLDYDGGEYGIAVLSRWPILSHTLVRLPVDPPHRRAGGSYEPRGALVVRLDAPGDTVAVVNTHLDASRKDHYRRQEVDAVRRLANRLRARHPRTLVGGDFNAEPGTTVIERMEEAGWTDAWSTCGDGAGLTFPADAPIKRIDYLFLAPTLSCDSARVTETTTSDHRPVLVRLLAPGSPR